MPSNSNQFGCQEDGREREEGETQKRTLQIFFKKNCSRPRLECSPHHYGFIFYEKKTSDMGEEEEVETKFEVLSPVRLFSLSRSFPRKSE